MGRLVFTGENTEKKEMIIGGSFLLLVIFFAAILLRHGPDEDDSEQRQVPEAVSVEVPASGKNGAPATFLLKPNPAELLAAIATASGAELPIDLTRYENTKVLWQVYFFRIRKTDGKTASVMFDSSADGFGVSVQAEIDATAFPDIKSIPPGQQVWLAGEIVAADTTGTGLVRIKAAYCNPNGDLAVGEIASDMAAHSQH